jgi:hypothetical protein
VINRAAAVQGGGECGISALAMSSVTLATELESAGIGAIL